MFLFATLLGSLALSGVSAQDAQPQPLSLGDLRRIAGFQLPPPGTKLQLHLAFPAGRPYAFRGQDVHGLTVVVDAQGTLRVANRGLLPASRNVSSQQRAKRLAACRDRAYRRDGPRWRRARMPIKWRWGRGIPNGIGRKATRRALLTAHAAWANLRSNCNHSVRSYARFRYKGRAGRNPHRDRVNLVDFGRLGSGAVGVTYTWFHNGRILESDLRLNSAYNWTNRRRGRGFRVANVAVHELGHQLGLGHVGNRHASLTMYSVTYPNEFKKVTLGRGDLRGVAAIYGR